MEYITKTYLIREWLDLLSKRAGDDCTTCEHLKDFVFENTEQDGFDNHEDPLYKVRIEIDGDMWEADFVNSNMRGVSSWFGITSDWAAIADIEPDSREVTCYRVETYTETVTRYRRIAVED